MLKRRGDAIEVLDGSQAHEKIEELPERNIERTNAAAHRRRQRALDSHVIFAERFHGIFRQPFVEFVLRRLPGKNLEPRDFLPAAVSFFYRRIEHALTRRPDVRPGTISTDKWNDRLIRYIQFIGSGNFFTCRRSDIFVWHKGVTVAAAVPAAISLRRLSSAATESKWTVQSTANRLCAV